MIKEFYNELKNLKNRFNEATTEEEKDLIRKDFKALHTKIEEKGKGFTEVFKLYETSQERENSRLDLGENCIWEKDVPKLLKALDDAKIKEMTFSSTWSSSNKIAFEFFKAGWKITGMTLVNTYKKWPDDGYEQEPAFIFTRG